MKSGTAAPMSFVKNGRTYRNSNSLGEGFETISQGMKKSPPSNKNQTEDLSIIQEPKFEKESRENKSMRKLNSAKKVREIFENRQIIKFSNSPKENIPLNYFDDDIITEEISAKNTEYPTGPENEFSPSRNENFYVSPNQSPTPEIENGEKLSRVRKIRVSTASVSSAVRTKSTKRKKKSLSFYSIRGVSLQSVPENEELSNFLVYHQIKSSRSSTISELLRQINKKL